MYVLLLLLIFFPPQAHQSQRRHFFSIRRVANFSFPLSLKAFLLPALLKFHELKNMDKSQCNCGFFRQQKQEPANSKSFEFVHLTLVRGKEQEVTGSTLVRECVDFKAGVRVLLSGVGTYSKRMPLWCRTLSSCAFTY